MFILTGHHIEYLTAFFNSNIFKYCFRDNFPELLGGTRELSKIFFDKIPVKKIDDKTNDFFRDTVNKRQITTDKSYDIIIEDKLFELYKLSPEEQAIIKTAEIL